MASMLRLDGGVTAGDAIWRQTNARHCLARDLSPVMHEYGAGRSFTPKRVGGVRVKGKSGIDGYRRNDVPSYGSAAVPEASNHAAATRDDHFPERNPSAGSRDSADMHPHWTVQQPSVCVVETRGTVVPNRVSGWTELTKVGGGVSIYHHGRPEITKITRMFQMKR